MFINNNGAKFKPAGTPGWAFNIFKFSLDSWFKATVMSLLILFEILLYFWGSSVCEFWREKQIFEKIKFIFLFYTLL